MHKKRIIHYRVPNPLHVSQLDGKLAKTIRSQISLIETMRCYDNDYAQEIRRAAELRLSMARDTLKARHGQSQT